MKATASNGSLTKKKKNTRFSKVPSEKLNSMREQLVRTCDKSRKRLESAQSRLSLVSEELDSREQVAEKL
jgi:hypothetical protein